MGRIPPLGHGVRLGLLDREFDGTEKLEMDVLGRFSCNRSDSYIGVDWMIEGEIRELVEKVVNRAGLHARPAAALVKLAGTFQSDIHVEKGGLQVNGKSIMGVLMLAAEQGSSLRLTAVGPDADEALEALADLVRRGFEEE